MNQILNRIIEFLDFKYVHLDTRIKSVAGIEAVILVIRFSHAAILKSNMAAANQILSKTILFLDLKYVHLDTRIKFLAGIEPELFAFTDFLGRHFEIQYGGHPG